jgi:hypothetical protein
VNDKCEPRAIIVNTGQKDRKTNMEIQKLYAFVLYSKLMKGRPVPQLLPSG